MIEAPSTFTCFGEIVDEAVAVALGRDTAMISAVPEGPIGDGTLCELRPSTPHSHSIVPGGFDV